MNVFRIFLIALAGAAAGPVMGAYGEDVYGESGLPAFKESEPTPVQPVALPSWPSVDALLPIDVDDDDNSAGVWIDPASISAGGDHIVRYTVVIRAGTGVENIMYEGLRCDSRQYRRYAYGSAGSFRPVSTSDWKYIRKTARDRYRAILLDDYFCPVPKHDAAEKIRKKLPGRR
ncbi:MAG: CNP1-like family protein [Thiogranum sp.]|nr:CNP1-like family protein [Thiogranum sp.]